MGYIIFIFLSRDPDLQSYSQSKFRHIMSSTNPTTSTYFLLPIFPVLSYKLHFYLAGYFDNHLKFKSVSYHFSVVDFVVWLFSSIIPLIYLNSPNSTCILLLLICVFFFSYTIIFFLLPILQNQGCSKHLKLLHFLIQLF